MNVQLFPPDIYPFLVHFEKLSVSDFIIFLSLSSSVPGERSSEDVQTVGLYGNDGSGKTVTNHFLLPYTDLIDKHTLTSEL